MSQVGVVNLELRLSALPWMYRVYVYIIYIYMCVCAHANEQQICHAMSCIFFYTSIFIVDAWHYVVLYAYIILHTTMQSIESILV